MKLTRILLSNKIHWSELQHMYQNKKNVSPIKKKNPPISYKPLPIFEGKNIICREITHADTNFLIQWRNDPAIQKFVTLTPYPLTKECHSDFLGDYFNCPTSFYFIIEHKHLKTPIGAHGLYNFDEKNKSIEYGWGFINPGFKLHTLEASFLLINFALSNLRCKSIYVRILEENIKSRKYNKHLGFVETSEILEINNTKKSTIRGTLTKETFKSATKTYSKWTARK